MTLAGPGVKILLVDDDPAIQRGYGQRMRQEGWDVTTASDGYEALTAAQAKPWSLILLDLRIPYRNGVEVLRLLRQRQETSQTLVYVLAQPGDADFVDRAMREGANGVFEKARMGPRDIVHEVSAILDGAARAPAPAARSVPTGPSASVPTDVDDIAKRFRKPDSTASAQSSSQLSSQPSGHTSTRFSSRSPTASSWLSGGPRAQTASGLPAAGRRAPPIAPVHDSLPPYGVLDEDEEFTTQHAAQPTHDEPTHGAPRGGASAAAGPSGTMHGAGAQVATYDTMLNRAVGQAGALASALGLPSDLTCPVCSGPLLLRLAIDPAADNGVRGQFRCNRCTGA